MKAGGWVYDFYEEWLAEIHPARAKGIQLAAGEEVIIRQVESPTTKHDAYGSFLERLETCHFAPWWAHGAKPHRPTPALAGQPLCKNTEGQRWTGQPSWAASKSSIWNWLLSRLSECALPSVNRLIYWRPITWRMWLAGCCDHQWIILPSCCDQYCQESFLLFYCN